MTSVKIYNLKGESTGEMELPDFLQTKWKPQLVYQVVKSLMANLRKSIAHTKTRGEVRGGGKKPWRQKGTGRARHSSIRSPLWKGGGVTFGPRKEKDYSEKINKKMLKEALLSVLSKKALEGEIKIVDSFSLGSSKTKPFAAILKKITNDNSTLLLLPLKNKNLLLASRNLRNVKSVPANTVNAYNLLSAKEILMDKETLINFNK